jgi:hypothetical protein
MQRIFHSLPCLLLTLALTLTGPGGAGPAKGDMLIEICSDGATSMVWVDADGNTVPPGGTHAKVLKLLVVSALMPGTMTGLPARNSLPVVARHSMFVLMPVLPLAHLCPIPRGPLTETDGLGGICDSNADTLTHNASDLRLLDNLQVPAIAGMTGYGATT